MIAPTPTQKLSTQSRAVHVGFLVGKSSWTQCCLTTWGFRVSYHVSSAPHLHPFVPHRRVLVRTLISSVSKLRLGPTQKPMLYFHVSMRICSVK
jgi:hypothetical protein